MVRAVLRLVVMALVTAGVLVTATAVGLPIAAVAGLAITIAGLVGMVGLSRRGSMSAADAMEHEDTVARAAHANAAPATAARAMAAGVPMSDLEAPSDPAVAVMAPDAVVDPESLMPRWRRPSLIAARKADPMRVARDDRMPMRFGPAADSSPNRRIVRYAVVSLLDRPDEVQGHQVSDLMSGDEVEVLDNGGSFWEILCPDGKRGWVHRTTLGMPGSERTVFGRRPDTASEPDDILTAVLSARGIL